MKQERQVEPWLRGTRTETDAVRRAVLHALDQAEEDVRRWCGGLNDEEIHRRPSGLPPVAFHLKHMARGLDRLLTYAEGRHLTEEQMGLLKSELDGQGSAEQVRTEFLTGVAMARERVLMVAPETLKEARGVGRAQLPTTTGGLLVHIAEHTMRHVGQAITTAKVVLAERTG